MSAGTYISHFIEDPNWEKAATATAVGVALIALAAVASAPIRRAQNVDDLVVPKEKMGLFGFFDVFLEGFVRFQDSVLGKENRHYLPLCGTVFLFIFASNLLGLVPGMAAITASHWINPAMAFVVFFAFNVYGIRAHGVKGYLAHFCGPVLPLAILIFPVEIASTCLRVLTLNLRLYWNITADHILLETITNMVPLAPVLLYGLGTFVALVQAFVFTLLTMIYILLAVQHDEDH